MKASLLMVRDFYKCTYIIPKHLLNVLIFKSYKLELSYFTDQYHDSGYHKCHKQVYHCISSSFQNYLQWQTGIYIYNMIQYLCISLPSFKTSFSNTPPLLIIDLTEPMLSLSQTNKTLSIPSFLHFSKAKLIILVA